MFDISPWCSWKVLERLYVQQHNICQMDHYAVVLVPGLSESFVSESEFLFHTSADTPPHFCTVTASIPCWLSAELTVRISCNQQEYLPRLKCLFPLSSFGGNLQCIHISWCEGNDSLSGRRSARLTSRTQTQTHTTLAGLKADKTALEFGSPLAQQTNWVRNTA